jgi:hypothetical protein
MRFLSRRFSRSLATHGTLTLANQSTSAPAESLDMSEKISLLKWHLDRYDRLRASTASRASVVLSATAILSAGNALVISQLLGAAHSVTMPAWLLGGFTAAALGGAALIALSLIRASRVLVTTRDSRSIFAPNGDLPAGLLFNGTDTVRRIPSFRDFQEVVRAQGSQEVLDAAQVELWITIQQHRQRYSQLRLAVRHLRWAAVTFLVILSAALAANLAMRL